MHFPANLVGHRVPVWCKQGDCCVEVHVGTHPPEGKDWEQDPDTLDTWFSAALWTWSTLVDPKVAKDSSLSLEEMLQKSPDFQKFHPTNVLETGRDILFFWVARMILMTTYATGQIPFNTVYLHGMVLTRDGKKMSKSDPASTIDPLVVIKKYGADALRLSMIVGQSPGNDFRLYEEKIAGYRNFVNKLWNATRFVLLECEKAGVEPGKLKIENGELKMMELSLSDRALLHGLRELIENVTKGVESYRLSEVGENIYNFVWDFFCDWYVELSKEGKEEKEGKEVRLNVLIHAMRILLRLLHPYIPFVTEELWGSFKPQGAGMLIKEEWPSVDSSLRDESAWRELQIVIEVIRSIRALRSDYDVEPGKQIAAVLVAKGETSALLEREQAHIRRLARIEHLTIQDKKYEGGRAASAFTTNVDIHLPLDNLIDAAKERARLMKKQASLQKFLRSLEAKLNDAAFARNAPPEVVEKERAKEKEAREKLAKIEERLKGLE